MPKKGTDQGTGPKSSSRPRILFLDIETCPLTVYSWGLWDQNIGVDMIGLEWSILSFSAKWMGEKKVHYYDSGGRGVDKVRDDLHLVKLLWDFLDQADIVVAQNGKKFDIRKINARMLMLKFKPYSPIKVVDTKIVAQRHFELTSNGLAWLSEHLTEAKKLKHKEFPGFELWEECLKDNPKAWAAMRKYNINDTRALEQLYLVLLPWIEGHPNTAVYNEFEGYSCPKCKGTDVQKRGRSFTQTGEYHRFQCTSCGGWSRSRYTLNTIEKRKTLLSN